MKLLYIEPYFGGSHREFAENLVEYSSHEIELLTLPARNWGWRMRGSALHFSKIIGSMSDYDGIIVTSMMRLADLKAITGNKLPPVLVYFHENQLTYPLAPGEKRDFNLCISDITTALTADRVLFNSKFQMNAFLNAVPEILNRVPDYPVVWVKDEIIAKTGFVYPGCRFDEGDQEDVDYKSSIPLIVWNHRWSYDKNAASFFFVLDLMKKRGIEFELALLGERSEMIPDEFKRAAEQFSDRIVQYGYVENKDAYIAWLKKGTVAVSTAKQENFGIAMVEAMRYGCIPLLPNRLSYPEILPEQFHSEFLYNNQKDFIDKLLNILNNHHSFDDRIKGLSLGMECYSWENMVSEYDHEMNTLCDKNYDQFI